MRKSNKILPMRSLKTCNLCGSDVINYQVIDNGIVCYDCVPIEQKPKKIPNEKQMLTKILDKNKTLC